MAIYVLVTFATVKIRVEKMRTSPDWCLEEVGDETTVEFTVELGGGAEPLAAVSRDRDDGTGEG